MVPCLNTWNHFLLSNDVSNANTVYVSKKAFGSIFSISKHVIDKIVRKVKNKDFSSKDGRGKQNNRSNIHS